MTKRTAGIIFDLDDTLIVSAPLWWDAEAMLLESIGEKWSYELSLKYKGMNALDVAATIHDLFHPRQTRQECQTLMRERLVANFRSRPVEPRPGAVPCIRRMGALAPLAVASGSPAEAIHTALEQLGVRDAFQVVLSSEAVARGKPSPDVFVAAARGLGAPAEHCLVFEDSLVGVQAARAAGMKSFAIPSSHAEEIRQLATRVYDSLNEVREEDARSVLGMGEKGL